MQRVIACLACALLAAGCASDPEPVGLLQDSSTLSGSRWFWLGRLGGGETLVIADPQRYRLHFAGGGQLQVQADCNLGSSRWQFVDGLLQIDPVMTTRLGCPGDSQGTAFVQALETPRRPLLRDGLLEMVADDGSTLRFAARADTRWAEFRCERGPLSVLFQGSVARVDFDGDRLRLAMQPSGSGYSYGQGDIELRGKGREAMLTRGGRPLSGRCQAL